MLSEKIIGGELNAGDDIRVAFRKKRFVIENKKTAQTERLEQDYEEMY
jgi:hypothetical protein